VLNKNLKLSKVSKVSIYFLCIIAISFVWRLLIGTPLIISKVELGGAVIVLYGLFLFKFHKKITLISILISFVLASLILLRLFIGASLETSFIKAHWSEGLILSGALLQIVFFSKLTNGYWRKVLVSIVSVAVFLLFIPVTIYWGYWAISSQWLQADIILAICQTNLSEAKAYLESQSLIALITCLGLLFLVLFACIYFVKILFSVETINIKEKPKIWCAGIIILFLVSLGLSIKAIKVSAPYMLYQSVRQSLGDYERFSELRQVRENKLNSLTGLTIQEKDKGVYVLVIGESESRDHMSLYGYNRETTPWLKEFSKNMNTLVFDNAYSNHTHTVQSLTYALSEKNQYNDISLEQANSIMEISKAVGIKTYWLSNQAKYGAWDTPIAEIGSTATTQVWLNGNGGEETTTVYYDDKLIEEVARLKSIENGLIVIHVMGSHGSYEDRFPATFNKFSGSKEDIDSYDNSILFNDYVLSQIYKEISQNPNYKAMIMMSDHGEDVEGKNAHESSKFTYSMARIPLIVNFSESYINDNQQVINTLKNHQQAYWTNDLLYDLLLSILGIQGAPVVNSKLDLSSPEYDRTLENIRTLHGKKKIIE